MADIIDVAEIATSKYLEVAIERSRKGKTLPFIGRCHNCIEPLPQGFLFCDADCRDDYERRQKLFWRV